MGDACDHVRERRPCHSAPVGQRMAVQSGGAPTRPESAALARALSRVDGGTRLGEVGRLQGLLGNASVQRIAEEGVPSGDESDDIAGRIAGASGGGTTLDTDVRERLERALGADLGHVRVHTGSEADRLSRTVQAKALTSGSDVFFRSGAYDPSSEEGLRTLAHEVTHTLQQAAGPVDGTPGPGGISLSHPSDRYEVEASSAADAVVRRSRPAGTSETGSGEAGGGGGATSVQREEKAPLDYQLVPPSATLRPTPGLTLSADTGSASARFGGSQTNATLGYNFGQDIFAAGRAGPLSGRAGFNPGTMGGSLSLGYGAPLAPMPGAVSSSVYGGEAAGRQLLQGIPSFVNDPLGTYRAQQPNIDAVTGTVGTLRSVADAGPQQGGLKFGAGANFSVTPDPATGTPDYRAMFGLQGTF